MKMITNIQDTATKCKNAVFVGKQQLEERTKKKFKESCSEIKCWKREQFYLQLQKLSESCIYDIYTQYFSITIYDALAFSFDWNARSIFSMVFKFKQQIINERVVFLWWRYVKWFFIVFSPFCSFSIYTS